MRLFWKQTLQNNKIKTFSKELPIEIACILLKCNLRYDFLLLNIFRKSEPV